MFLAAAQSTAATTVDRIRQIPSEFWLKLGVGIAAIIVLVILLRKVAKANKVVMTVVVFVAVTVVGFSWIYERNEPTWATPAVDFLSGWFPTKGKLEQKKHGL